MGYIRDYTVSIMRINRGALKNENSHHYVSTDEPRYSKMFSNESFSGHASWVLQVILTFSAPNKIPPFPPVIVPISWTEFAFMTRYPSENGQKFLLPSWNFLLRVSLRTIFKCFSFLMRLNILCRCFCAISTLLVWLLLGKLLALLTCCDWPLQHWGGQWADRRQGPITFYRCWYARAQAR